MHAIRLNVKKQRPEVKTEEVVDLDEKIRRIREQNKAREKRFKEIENDKLNAETNTSKIDGDNQHGKESNGDYQKRKFNKGRGQRLLDMTKEPLRAKSFQLRTFHHSSLNATGNKVKIKKDRKFGKFKIWKRNEDKDKVDSDGGNIINHSTDGESLDQGLLKLEDFDDQTYDDNITKAITQQVLADDKKNENHSLSVTDEGIDINTSELLREDSKESVKDIIIEETNEETKDDIFDEKGHKERPTIMINTKLTKTTSTSSFDEAIMLMSPLEVPANWGDCDFEENEDYFNRPITF